MPEALLASMAAIELVDRLALFMGVRRLPGMVAIR
jgi:hypothetical protein